MTTMPLRRGSRRVCGFVLPILFFAFSSANHARAGLELEWATEPESPIFLGQSTGGTVTANFVPESPGVGVEETYTHHVAYTYSWSADDGGTCSPGDAASAVLSWPTKGEKTVTVTVKAVGSYTITDSETGATRTVDIDETEILTATVQAVELIIEMKRANLTDWGGGADIAVGGKSSDVHKADIRIKLDPVPSSALEIDVALGGAAVDGAGSSPVKTMLTIGSLSISGIGGDTLSLTAAETMGQLASSNKMGAQTVSIGDQSVTASNVWDNFAGDGAWFSEPEYFTQPGESRETVTFKLDNAPLDGHEIRFYIEEVVYVDLNDVEHIVSNTASSPNDVSEYAAFRSMAAITDSSGTAEVDLLINDPVGKYIVSLLLVAYDADARNDSPGSSSPMRAISGAQGIFQPMLMPFMRAQAQAPDERQLLENKSADGRGLYVRLVVDSDNNNVVNNREPDNSEIEEGVKMISPGMILPVSYQITDANSVRIDQGNWAYMMLTVPSANIKGDGGTLKLVVGDKGKLALADANGALLIHPASATSEAMVALNNLLDWNAFRLIPLSGGETTVKVEYTPRDAHAGNLVDTIKVTCVDLEVRNGTAVVARPALTAINSPLDRYVYAGQAPDMNNLSARRSPELAGGGAAWIFDVYYARNGRNDIDRYSDNGQFVIGDVNIAARMANDMRGGLGRILYHYQAGNVYLPEAKVFFHIRGTNPAPADVSTHIDGIPGAPWYLLPIARHESGTPAGAQEFRHFNPGNNVGPAWGDYIRCPNFGAPNGWGIMQLDNPPATAQQLWHWKENINEGNNRLTACRQEAEVWLNRQINQQQGENPDLPLSSRLFTFNGHHFRQPPDAPNPNDPLAHAVVTGTPLDAITIQRYNGAPLWVVYWRNRIRDFDQETGMYIVTYPGSWELRETHRGYVDLICGRIGQ